MQTGSSVVCAAENIAGWLKSTTDDALIIVTHSFDFKQITRTFARADYHVVERSGCIALYPRKVQR